HSLYRGSDALEKFVEKIEGKLLNIQEDLSAPAEIIIAPGDLKAYNEATESKHRLLEVIEWEASMGEDHSEKKKIQKEYRKALSRLNRKVKDYDHISGKYRGPAYDI
ncbi:14775_t:CDS:2, partial [Funneliformis geosporum]